MYEEEYKGYCAKQAHDWLVLIHNAKVEVDTLRLIIENERELLDGLKGLSYDGLGGGSGEDNPLDAHIDNISEGIKNYTASLANYIDMLNEAWRAVEKLEDATDRYILSAHYFTGMPWAEVEKGIHYSHRTVMRKRLKALAELYEYMPLQYRDPRPPAL